MLNALKRLFTSEPPVEEKPAVVSKEEADRRDRELVKRLTDIGLNLDPNAPEMIARHRIRIQRLRDCMRQEAEQGVLTAERQAELEGEINRRVAALKDAGAL